MASRKMTLEEACLRIKENDSSLRIMNLADVCLRDTGAVALAFSLKRNEFLTELTITNCSIGPSGAIKIAGALKENYSLEKLYMQNNTVGDKGCEGLAAALRENESLRLLNLANNGVGDIGVAALADVLVTGNKALRRLYLYNNIHIGNVGASALAEIVMYNRTLHELFVWDCKIGDSGCSELKRAYENAEGTSLQLKISWGNSKSKAAASTKNKQRKAAAGAVSPKPLQKPSVGKLSPQQKAASFSALNKHSPRTSPKSTGVVRGAMQQPQSSPLRSPSSRIESSSNNVRAMGLAIGRLPFYKEETNVEATAASVESTPSAVSQRAQALQAQVKSRQDRLQGVIPPTTEPPPEKIPGVIEKALALATAVKEKEENRLAAVKKSELIVEKKPNGVLQRAQALAAKEAEKEVVISKQKRATEKKTGVLSKAKAFAAKESEKSNKPALLPRRKPPSPTETRKGKTFAFTAGKAVANGAKNTNTLSFPEKLGLAGGSKYGVRERAQVLAQKEKFAEVSRQASSRKFDGETKNVVRLKAQVPAEKSLGVEISKQTSVRKLEGPDEGKHGVRQNANFLASKVKNELEGEVEAKNSSARLQTNAMKMVKKELVVKVEESQQGSRRMCLVMLELGASNSSNSVVRARAAALANKAKADESKKNEGTLMSSKGGEVRSNNNGVLDKANALRGMIDAKKKASTILRKEETNDKESSTSESRANAATLVGEAKEVDTTANVSVSTSTVDETEQQMSDVKLKAAALALGEQAKKAESQVSTTLKKPPKEECERASESKSQFAKFREMALALEAKGGK